MIDELLSNYKNFESQLSIASPPHFEHTLTFAPCQGGWISKFVPNFERLRGFPALNKKTSECGYSICF